MPFEQDYLCATCKQTDRSCPMRDYSTTECQFYAPDLPNVYQPSRKPALTEYAAVDAMLKELERAKALHDWSGYDLLKAARKVLAEACELLHAVEHYDEGRDTIEHVIEEVNHVGGTAIRVRMMVEEIRGETMTDGGPAFPNEYKHWECNDAPHLRGMSLRDYFAAAALQIVIKTYCDGNAQYAEGLAKEVYLFADAMLKARGE